MSHVTCQGKSDTHTTWTRVNSVRPQKPLKDHVVF